MDGDLLKKCFLSATIDSRCVEKMRKFIKRDECTNDQKILSLDNIGEWEMIGYDRMQDEQVCRLKYKAEE